MRSIDKKIWTRFFKLMEDGDKTVDLRLADFEVEPGDQIRFNEYDPETDQYSGRSLIKTVARVNHVHLTDFHTPEEIHEKGHLIIEFEEDQQ